MSTPALVIGAGPNGLAAAIRLAEEGVAVTVLEAQDAPGGAVRTEELTLPGFRHDTFSSVYPAGAASPVFARMGLGRHGLRWIHPEACYAHPLPSGRAIALRRDLDATAEGLDAEHPGDGERWRAFAAPLLEAFDAVRATMLAGFPPLRAPVRLLAELGPLGAAEFARLVPGSAQALGGRLFRGQGSRAWLYGSAGHGDVPPGGAGSAIAVTYLNLLGHAVGWPSPAGGAQALTDALVSRLRELGGSVRTAAPVEAILATGERVSGVMLAGGERIAAAIVIADVMPHALIAMCGAALPRRYSALLRRFRYGPATIKVDWALDGPIPWEAPAAREAGTVHVGGGEHELVESMARARRGLPRHPFLLLGQQSLADPSRAPAGDRHVERIEAQVERFAPGFRSRILARHVMAPAELERRNRNLVGGDVGGGSYRLAQIIFRPVPGISPYRTPLRGLYLGSAATFPGGAVHGVPGDAAARAALTDRRRAPA